MKVIRVFSFFLSVFAVSKPVFYIAYENMWLKSVASRNSYYEQQVNKNADKFKKKADDSDDDFDKIFGDGSELIELDF